MSENKWKSKRANPKDTQYFTPCILDTSIGTVSPEVAKQAPSLGTISFNFFHHAEQQNKYNKTALDVWGPAQPLLPALAMKELSVYFCIPSLEVILSFADKLLPSQCHKPSGYSNFSAPSKIKGTITCRPPLLANVCKCMCITKQFTSAQSLKVSVFALIKA